jgi:hypothetical protein
MIIPYMSTVCLEQVHPLLLQIMLKLGSDLFLMGTSLPSHPNFRDSLDSNFEILLGFLLDLL